MLLLLVAVYGGGHLLVVQMSLKKEVKPGSVDRVTFYRARFDLLKRDLPPDAIVGYLTDQPPSPGTDLRLTQYVLAPAIVRGTLKAEQVVGNFHDPQKAVLLLRKEGLAVIRDYGHGVFLLKGRPE
ncbi:MAG TPA: hypothetical protein VMY39_02815 [Planctomycetota bacterium]|nr:hypothetical protein [Planctomycetota bacterium]